MGWVQSQEAETEDPQKQMEEKQGKAQRSKTLETQTGI
jgi:hypothetical protein